MSFNFKDIDDVQYLEAVDLTKYSTFKLKVIGDLCIVSSEEALKKLIKEIIKDNKTFHLIGWGANQIIKEVKNKIFIKLNFDFDRSYLKEVREEYSLPASVGLNVLQSHAQKFGLKGWEVFTGIPASLGGALVMNAGTNLGEIGNIVKSIRILTREGEIYTHTVDHNSFSYRNNNFLNDGDIILSAKLIHHGIDKNLKIKIKEYMEMRKRTQPLASYNCGCVFKNFDQSHRAGQFIDTLGLKGLEYKDLIISNVHANFIENKGEPTSEDFEYFSEKILDILELHSGIRFELEVKIY